MASAYGTFANDGVHFEPYYVEEVTDRDGNVLFEGPTTGKPVLDPGIARTVTSVLVDNVRSGTGTRAAFPDGRQAAGKTGTTQDSADAWFVGYTPELSTAVWMGSPVDRTPMSNVGGIRVTGGTYPARMWQAYMGPALQPFEPLSFPEPPAPDPKRVSKRLRLPSEAWAAAVAEAAERRAPQRRPTTTSPARRSTPSTTAPGSGSATTATSPATTATSPATTAAPAATAPPASQPAPAAAEGASAGDGGGDGGEVGNGNGSGNGNGRGNGNGSSG
jgi:penicillin-binding protein 1A